VAVRSARALRSNSRCAKRRNVVAPAAGAPKSAKKRGGALPYSRAQNLQIKTAYRHFCEYFEIAILLHIRSIVGFLFGDAAT